MKTKIVATLGPASSSPAMLRQLMKAGADVFRLNFSHSSHDAHREAIASIRSLNAELGLHTAILADLQGPKIRIGMMENGQAQLPEGHKLVFTNRETICTADRLYITYPDFAADVKPGEDIILDDGKLLMRVLETNGTDEVKAQVIHGGILSSKKGVNLPNTKVSIPSLTEKDLLDLEFALQNRVNWIALSFVRKAQDILHLKDEIAKRITDGYSPKIIAKIEKPEAVANMDEIIAAADGVMVARGDLGVELPLEQVPLVQKTLVNKCIAAAKPVIIATQMMEGMISNIRPTRAEVNDVANSVLDGADALMLSGETSVGMFPVEVVMTMKKIIGEVEQFQNIYDKRHIIPETEKGRLISDAILYSACSVASESNARAIVAMSHTGYSAGRISSQRPRQDMYIFSNNHELLCTLNLLWGIKGIFYDNIVTSTSKTLKSLTEKLKNDGLIKQGDLIVYAASTPIYVSGKTNMLKLAYA